MAARQVASLFGVLRLDDSDYKNKLSQAQTNTQNFGQQLRTQGQNLQQMGAGMTAFFAPVGVAMGYAITQGHNFDRTFSNINSILQLGAEEAAALRAEILAYGSGTVAGPQATAEAYYEIVSGVADASTHMAILEAATRTAEAGQADLGATTSALISTMNAYGFSAADAAHVSDVFSRTVGMGVLTMDELAAAFPQVTGLGAQFGVSIDELGAGMAYLTAQGYSASQSATFMRSMMTTLLNPTTELQAAITALGYESGAALLEAEGLTGAYELLAAQNGGLDGLITNTEALNGALVLTSDGAEGFFNTYNEGITGSTDRAGAIQDETEQWDILKAQLDGLAIQLSTALMPTLNDLTTNYITPAVTAISGWIAENPQLTAGIGLLVAGLVIAGPIIGMVGTAMTLIGGAMTAAGVAAGGLTLAIGILTSPFVAIGLIIAGFIWMINRPGGLIGTLNEAATNATALVAQLTEIARLAGQNIGDWAQETYDNAMGIEHQNTGRQGVIVPQGNADGTGYAPAGVPMEWQEPKSGGEIFIPRITGSVLNAQQQFAAGMMAGRNFGNEPRGGDTYQIAIYANSEEEGAAAADGFERRFNELRRMRGITVNG